MARVEAARACQSGVQIKTMDQIAARLAGGFLEPIDTDALEEAVSQAISTIPLGELEKIRDSARHGEGGDRHAREGLASRY